MSDGIEYLWLPKDVTVGAPGWCSSVVAARVCPDQRKFRRLSYRERHRYFDERLD